MNSQCNNFKYNRYEQMSLKASPTLGLAALLPASAGWRGKDNIHILFNRLENVSGFGTLRVLEQDRSQGAIGTKTGNRGAEPVEAGATRGERKRG
jgi:hypothetical protein